MRYALLCALAVTFAYGVMAQYVPPNFYGVPESKALVFVENKGQLVDQYGDGADEMGRTRMDLSLASAPRW